MTKTKKASQNSIFSKTNKKAEKQAAHEILMVGYISKLMFLRVNVRVGTPLSQRKRL